MDVFQNALMEFIVGFELLVMKIQLCLGTLIGSPK